MVCQIIVGALIGIGTAAKGYNVFDPFEPKKMIIAWSWIIFGNLFMAIIANIFHLP